jgi:hypothetical protein
MDVFIPRSLIEPGATNAIGFVPSWLCVRPTQFCGGGGFTFPYVTGEGNSGQRFGWGLTDIVLVQLAAGQTSVQVVDMPGKGAVDGTNGTFELIAWNAEGAPSASINGIDVPVGEVVYDTALLTATITPPPPAGALVLFTYMATT